MPPKWAILGIHGRPDVPDEPVTARVRLFLGGDRAVVVDEDFALPRVHPSVPRTEHLYAALLAPAIEQRWTELSSRTIEVTSAPVVDETKLLGE